MAGDPRLFRMIDANLNRASEGLRVTEDVLRFVLDRRVLSGEARRLRHEAESAVRLAAPRAVLVAARDTAGDVGRRRWRTRDRRGGTRDLLAANLRRAQESARVLEEAARALHRPAAVLRLQRWRYGLYAFERRIWAACRLP